MSTDSITEVARDLREITYLAGHLETQAINRASDRLMPGGRATAALAYVGSPREWAEQVAADELYHLTICPKPDHRRCRYAEQASDGEDDETPLQTLLFWSEAWRDEHGYEFDKRPTLTTEVGFIRASLNWAWVNEIHWDDFREDIAKVRTQLENLLMDGIRSERGVPCMYDECKGKRLVRKMQPTRDPEGHKVWRLTNWHCPRCHREWTEERYQASIAAAAWAAQAEDVEGEVWCSAKYAARQVDRTEGCIRGWISKHGWAQLCIVKGRRIGFVRLADVREHAEKAKRRNRAA